MTPANALARLEALCARAEHCTGEMRDKLRAWKIDASEADKIIGSLVQRRFVDDERFARAYVRDKQLFSKWGRRKIAQGLAVKRVDRGIIKQALDDLDREEYLHILDSVLAARLRQDPAMLASYEGRAKLLRFAMQRGFESSLALARIQALTNYNADV